MIPPQNPSEDRTGDAPDILGSMSDAVFASTFLPNAQPAESGQPEPDSVEQTPAQVQFQQAPLPTVAREVIAEPIKRRPVRNELERVGSRLNAPTSRPASESPKRRVATETIPLAVFAIVAAMAIMPMFLTHLGHLSQMPHRAHYGLVLIGFVVLVARRWYRAVGGPNLRFTILDVGLLVGAGVAFATASRVGSPWIGVFSCILLANVFLRRLPSVDRTGYAGPWLFLFLILPLPLGFDLELIKSLQLFATGCSSRLLDLLSVNHLVSGNVLELPGSQLFIDEACSGIQSLFAMLTCVAFFAAWTRRPAVLCVPLLAASVVMCTVVNILRIVIVVHAELRGINLVSGWSHECLGAGLFVLALWLVHCSEGLFLFLLAPIINPATGTPDNRSARFWNNLTRGIHGAVFDVLDPEQTEEAPPASSRLLNFLLPQSVGRFATFGATVCFAFCGISQHVGGADPGVSQPTSQVEASMVEQSERLQEDALPESLGAWKRIEFERIDQTTSTQLITDSVSWVYRSPFYKATVSLDYPFFGAHNVSECYHLRGWDVNERVTTTAGYSKATLSRPFGETALLYYDVFDSTGTVELQSPAGKMSERLKQFQDSSKRPTWQLQLIIQSDFGLSTTDLDDIETAFVEIRDEIRERVTSRGTGGSSYRQKDFGAH